MKALEVSRYYNILILLKGHYSKLVRPDGKVYINSSGTPAMATAGSGDVLTGVFAGLTAQGMTLFEAAKLAVFLHGCAGDAAAQKYGKRSMTANDLVEGLIRVLADADDKNKCK